MGFRHAGDVDERRAGLGIGDIENRGGSLRNGGFDLPILGIANACAGIAVWQTDLDNGDASSADGVIIKIPLAADHDDFVFEACCVGQTRHARGVEARDTGGGGQEKAGGSAGGDITGFGTGDISDDAGGCGLKFGDIDAMPGCLDHCS